MLLSFGYFVSTESGSERLKPITAVRHTRQLGGRRVEKVLCDRTNAYVPRQLIKTVEPFKSARMVSF